jgi:hypothetical protein
MIWTIIIVGVKQFLQVTEVLNKTVERFQQDLSIVNKHDVKGIVDSVFGKSDSTKTYLTMWDDEECQEFSPTRAIFLWLKSPV